jgi:hypothetical protein
MGIWLVYVNDYAVIMNFDLMWTCNGCRRLSKTLHLHARLIIRIYKCYAYFTD